MFHVFNCIVLTEISRPRRPCRGILRADRASFTDGRVTFSSDRVPLSSGRASFSRVKVTFTSDRASFTSDKVALTSGRASFTDGRGTFTSDRAALSSDSGGFTDGREGGWRGAGRRVWGKDCGRTGDLPPSWGHRNQPFDASLPRHDATILPGTPKTAPQRLFFNGWELLSVWGAFFRPATWYCAGQPFPPG